MNISLQYTRHPYTPAGSVIRCLKNSPAPKPKDAQSQEQMPDRYSDRKKWLCCVNDIVCPVNGIVPGFEQSRDIPVKGSRSEASDEYMY